MSSKLHEAADTVAMNTKFPGCILSTYGQGGEHEVYLALKTRHLGGPHQQETIAQGSLSHLPGDETILVSHNAWVDPAYRRSGVGNFMHRLRLEIARKADARAIICTVANDNDVQQALLRKNGWSSILAITPTSRLFVYQIKQG